MCLKYLLLILSLIISCSHQQQYKQQLPQPKTNLLSKENIKYNEITWQNFEPATLIKSKLQKKLVAIYMYSDNCYQCYRMESSTFIDSTVIDVINENFIPVKVNGEERPDIEAALNEAHVYPSLILLAPDGTYIISINGYMPVKEFLTSLMMIVNIAKESGVIK